MPLVLSPAILKSSASVILFIMRDTILTLTLMKEQLMNHFHQELFEKFVTLFSRSGAEPGSLPP
jgi:hypothetical protein